MQLYLVQHGASKSESDDPQWGLTDKGRRVVEHMAQYLTSGAESVEDAYKAPPRKLSGAFLHGLTLTDSGQGSELRECSRSAASAALMLRLPTRKQKFRTN